jgi:hypothetical protein
VPASWPSSVFALDSIFVSCRGSVNRSAISACILYRRVGFSNWATRYGESAIPPLMGQPGLLIQDYVAGIPIWYILNSSP